MGLLNNVVAGFAHVFAHNEERNAINAIAPNGGFLSGTGSPQNVVAAPVGSRYIDTNATNGAVEWVKMSGAAGNTGWVCVSGDTGLRTIVSWGSSNNITKGAFASTDWGPFPTAAGSITVQRQSNTVAVTITQVAALVASPAGTMLILPNGFKPAQTQRVTVDKFPGSGLSSLMIQNTGIIQRGFNSAYTAADQIVGANFFYETVDDWPSTLP